MWGTGSRKHLGERIAGRHDALLGGSKNAHDDGLRLSTTRRAVAARALAVDDRGSDGVRRDSSWHRRRPDREEKQAVAISEKMHGEVKTFIVKIRVVEEAIHLHFDLPLAK